jgi:hypothetical protein
MITPVMQKICHLGLGGLIGRHNKTSEREEANNTVSYWLIYFIFQVLNSLTRFCYGI